jgi:hypothetical protein
VLKPELLSREEESYFLPFVFNIRENEARMDYLDRHGERGRVNPVLGQAWRQLLSVAKEIEAISSAPEAAWLCRLAGSIRIWSSILRSACNFQEAQRLRERNAPVLAGGERIPKKEGSFSGDADNIPWNSIMRDELDNAVELLALFEHGALDSICHARKPEDEFSFALGPDLKGALTKKIKIMRNHWRDVEKGLAPPNT